MKLIFLLFILIGCTQNNQNDSLDPIMSKEFVEELDNMPEAEVEVDDVILPNGMTIKEFNHYLIKTYPCKVLEEKGMISIDNISDEMRKQAQENCDQKKRK